MPPFIVSLRPSRLRRYLLLTFTSVLLVSIAYYCSGSLKIGLLIATLISSAWAWREPNAITHIHINAQGQAQLDLTHVTYHAQLCSGSLIHPYLCCLKWQLPEQIVWQWLWYDSSDTESLRRLRVWAAFGQHKQPNHKPPSKSD